MPHRITIKEVVGGIRSSKTATRCSLPTLKRVWKSMASWSLVSSHPHDCITSTLLQAHLMILASHLHKERDVFIFKESVTEESCVLFHYLRHTLIWCFCFQEDANDASDHVKINSRHNHSHHSSHPGARVLFNKHTGKHTSFPHSLDPCHPLEKFLFPSFFPCALPLPSLLFLHPCFLTHKLSLRAVRERPYGGRSKPRHSGLSSAPHRQQARCFA
jgi:hypothetical protein